MSAMELSRTASGNRAANPFVNSSPPIVAKPWKPVKWHWRAFLVVPILFTLCLLTWPAMPSVHVSVDVKWPRKRSSRDSISHLLNLPLPLGNPAVVSTAERNAEVRSVEPEAKARLEERVGKYGRLKDASEAAAAVRGAEGAPVAAEMAAVTAAVTAADRVLRVVPFTVKAMAVASAYRVADNSFVVIAEYLTPTLEHLKKHLIDQCAWDDASGRAVTAAEILWLRKQDYHGTPWAPVIIRCTFARAVGGDNNGGALLLRRNATEEPLTVKRYPLIIQETEMEVLQEDPGAFELIKQPPKYKIAHCSGPLYGSLRPRAVSDWLRFHSHAVGIQHFFLHDFGAISGEYPPAAGKDAGSGSNSTGGGDIGGVRTDLHTAELSKGASAAAAAAARAAAGATVAAAVQPFVDRGLVTVTRLLGHDRFRSHYFHQIMTEHDCLYRSRFLTKWLVFSDLDEYIFTPPPATLSSALTALENSHHAWASMGAYWAFVSRCRQKVEEGGGGEGVGGSSSSTSTSIISSSGGSTATSSSAKSSSSDGGKSSSSSDKGSSRELIETVVGREEIKGYEAQGLAERELIVEYLPMRSRLPICSSTKATANKSETFFCPEHFGRRKVVLDPRRIDLVSVHEVLLPKNVTGDIWNASLEAGMPVLMHFRYLLNQEVMPRCSRVRVEDTVRKEGEAEQLNVIDFAFSDYVHKAMAAS